jgi:hypothetical protein
MTPTPEMVLEECVLPCRTVFVMNHGKLYLHFGNSDVKECESDRFSVPACGSVVSRELGEAANDMLEFFC